MTLRLTDHEARALRRRADLEGRPMQEVARQAIREYVEGHSRAELLDRVLDEELPRYAEALERLAQGATRRWRGYFMSRSGCWAPSRQSGTSGCWNQPWRGRRQQRLARTPTRTWMPRPRLCCTHSPVTMLWLTAISDWHWPA